MSTDPGSSHEGRRRGPVVTGEDEVFLWLHPWCPQRSVHSLFVLIQTAGDPSSLFVCVVTPIDIEAALMLDPENPEAKSLMSSLVPHARVVRILQPYPTGWPGVTDDGQL